MRKFKLKEFAKWARKLGITDLDLNLQLEEMQRGMLGDRLGSDIYKKRISLSGRGKRAGARAILFFKSEEVAVFLYGYSKNEIGNLTPSELQQLRIYGKQLAERYSLNKEDLMTSEGLIEIKG